MRWPMAVASSRLEAPWLAASVQNVWRMSWDRQWETPARFKACCQAFFMSMRPNAVLLALEVIADCGIAFDADDCSPHRCAVFVFAFENRCHVSNLVLCLGLVGWRAG